MVADAEAPDDPGSGAARGPGPTDAADIAALRARVTTLEADRRRAFEDAQREADALFAQYQLSQLLASGGTLAELATAVGLELVRLAGAAGGGLWLDDGSGSALERVALAGEPPSHLERQQVPVGFRDLDTGRAWAQAMPGARAVVLSEAPPSTLLVAWPAPGATLDDDGLRVAQLARHELAVAFAGARLREAFERERRELEAIVDGATDCILQVDGEGAVVRLNPAGERLLGIDAAAALGSTCASVLGCEAAGGHGPDDCPLAEVRASGQPIAYRETMIRGANGSNVHVAGSYAASPGTSEAAGRATAILRDISAVKALDDLREGFVATVSHELRTPLALIRGYAETLLHLELDAGQQRAYVERIDEASGRLTAIVDQVLDVTHLQADPLILDRSRATFASLVARLRGDLAIAGGLERLRVDAPGRPAGPGGRYRAHRPGAQQSRRQRAQVRARWHARGHRRGGRRGRGVAGGPRR